MSIKINESCRNIENESREQFENAFTTNFHGLLDNEAIIYNISRLVSRKLRIFQHL